MSARTTIQFLACAITASIVAGPAAPQAGPGAAASAAPDCLPRPAVRRMQIVDTETVLFVMRDKTQFKNTLARTCPGLRRNSQLSFTVADQQVCSGTNFQVMLRVGSGSNSESVLLPGGSTMSVPRPAMVPGPICALGTFSAISEADAEALVESSRNRRREDRNRDDDAEDAPAAPEER
jgi:hypothetical protein